MNPRLFAFLFPWVWVVSAIPLMVWSVLAWKGDVGPRQPSYRNVVLERHRF
jgi:hypothetical protein